MEKIWSLLFALILASSVRGETESNFDITVAADGSGNFTKISEAVAAAPAHSDRRYYIKIKAGTYVENVIVGTDKTNLVFIGDDMDKTIITSNRSNKTGYGTIDTATVVIEGNGFIAKGITFANSAGPSEGQAVAVRCISNLSAFYKCRFKGYQDTLLADSSTQFYRECEIFGSNDFIFGNAAVVFQNCDIYVRAPSKGGECVITAQSREKSDEHTGISMHNCTITAAEDSKGNLGLTYLGRPWRSLATVVVMQSYLGDIISPKGWLEWDNNSDSITTLYYGEYQNKGPGANTSERVKWEGFRVMNFAEAQKFTVKNFINGETWIPSTNIPFSPDLL